MRANFSNQPPTNIQSTVGATAGLSDSAGFGSLRRSSPHPHRSIPQVACSSTSRTRRVWRTNNGGLSWHADRLGDRSRFRRASPPMPAHVPIEPLQPRRQPHRSESHRGRRRRRLPRHHHQRRRELDRHRPDREGARLSRVLSPTSRGRTTRRFGSPPWRRRPGPSASLRRPSRAPATAGRAPRSRRCRKGLPDLPVTRVYIDPRDPSRHTLLCRHARRRLPHHRRRTVMGVVQ